MCKLSIKCIELLSSGSALTKLGSLRNLFSGFSKLQIFLHIFETKFCINF